MSILTKVDNDRVPHFITALWETQQKDVVRMLVGKKVCIHCVVLLIWFDSNLMSFLEILHNTSLRVGFALNVSPLFHLHTLKVTIIIFVFLRSYV